MPFADPEKQRASHRAYYLRNRAVAIERSRAQRLANPEAHQAYNARYREANREKIRIQSREAQRRRKYGDVYERLLIEQAGLCALCTQPPAPGRTLHVDHDHACCATEVTCGKCVRSLLCETCNKGLGLFRDDPVLLRLAADYLDRTLVRV